MSRFELHQSHLRCIERRKLCSRLIMLSISTWDATYPVDVCYRPLPFMAPHYFTKTIHLISAGRSLQHD